MSPAVTHRLLSASYPSPSQIYSWFLMVFKVSVGIGALGYALLLMEVFGIGPLLRTVAWMPDPSVAFVALW